MKGIQKALRKGFRNLAKCEPEKFAISGLCIKCLQIGILAIERTEQLEHHSSFASLGKSARWGCSLCKLIMESGPAALSVDKQALKAPIRIVSAFNSNTELYIYAMESLWSLLEVSVFKGAKNNHEMWPKIHINIRSRRSACSKRKPQDKINLCMDNPRSVCFLYAWSTTSMLKYSQGLSRE